MPKTKVTIMDFYTESCQPCKRIPALLADVVQASKNVSIEMIDVDKRPTVADQYGVTALPTVVLKVDKHTINVSGWQLTKQHLLSRINELQA